MDTPIEGLLDETEDLERECYECGGDGWVVDQCDEDSCCCEDPEASHGLVPCSVCNLEGKQ